MTIVISLLRTISNVAMLILGLVVACYMVNPVENIIFHWFEYHADYPGNHFLTNIAAVFFNVLFMSMLYSIYIILVYMANNLIDKRHKQDLETIQQQENHVYTSN